MAFVWKAGEEACLPKEAAALAPKRNRPGTCKLYDAVWKSWCDRRKVNPLQTPINQIAEFLTHKFTEGKQYNTVKV